MTLKKFLLAILVNIYKKLRINMPTLNWIGKDKVISHHQDVPHRVLET